MFMRIFIVCYAVIWSVICFQVCRTCSAYFDLAKCKFFIKIRSSLLSGIFIANSIKAWNGGHRVQVKLSDAHKLSVLGGVAHIVIDIFCIFLIYTSIRYALFASKEAFSIVLDTFINLTFTLGVFIGLERINNCKVI